MADTVIDDDEELRRRRPAGVPLADEGPDELPALLAIAVGIAILVVTLIWPSIAPGGDGADMAETAANQVDEEIAEEEVEEMVEEVADLAAIEAGLLGLGLTGIDGIELGMNGSVVTATGEVPDEETRSQVIQYLSAQPGVDEVVDQLTVAAAEAEEEAETAGETGDATITAAQTSIVLTGVVPDQATADQIVERAASIYSEAQVDNQLTVDEAVSAPTTINVVGSLTDEVLYNQVAEGFGDIEGVEVNTDEFALEASGELEAGLNGLEPIQFASGSALILAESEPILDEAAAFLQANPDAVLEIGGHTDSTGSDESNQVLSQDRADAVKTALEERGVTNELTSVGYGERRLKVDPDDTPEAQQENRRIEFRLN